MLNRIIVHVSIRLVSFVARIVMESIMRLRTTISRMWHVLTSTILHSISNHHNPFNKLPYNKNNLSNNKNKLPNKRSKNNNHNNKQQNPNNNK